MVTNTAHPFIVVNPVEPGSSVQALFNKRFGHPLPAEPEHFVCCRAATGDDAPLGYVHFQKLDNVYLGGGMCTDVGALRRLPREERRALRNLGGVAEFLLRSAEAALSHAVGLFGYVGDNRAELVDLRAGYQFTRHPHLIVKWLKPVSEARRAELIERVAAIGPF